MILCIEELNSDFRIMKNASMFLMSIIFILVLAVTRDDSKVRNVIYGMTILYIFHSAEAKYILIPMSLCSVYQTESCVVLI